MLYEISLVSMTDEHIQEMYKVFSLLDGLLEPSGEPHLARLDEGEAADHAAAVSEAEAEKAALLERLGAGDGPLDDDFKEVSGDGHTNWRECVGTSSLCASRCISKASRSVRWLKRRMSAACMRAALGNAGGEAKGARSSRCRARGGE